MNLQKSNTHGEDCFWCGAVLGHLQKSNTHGEDCFWCGAVLGHLERSGLEFSQNLIFAVTYVVQCIKCGLNNLKLIYFSKFGLFLPSPKLIFPFYI